jgi:uncharacterized protein
MATLTRDLSTMFPGYYQTSTKRDHYVDFGFPKTLSFDHFYALYKRNGFARAAVKKTAGKTWQEKPSLQENEDASDVTTSEKIVAKRLQKLRFWQVLAEADKRSMVGGYAGVIFRFADGLPFNQPVGRMAAGLESLVEVIPAWSGQLIVSEFNQDQTSTEYGKPLMYLFIESAVGKQEQQRQFEVHPDRVFIWSEDGTTFCDSMLEPGYNDLVTAEKVIGSGGEGFWKTAKASPILEVDKDAKRESMAQAMGVPSDKLAEAMDDQIKDWQQGFDAMLMLQGITAKPTSVSLSDPSPFVNVALQPFAASIGMPIKILVGMQTGERASQEDSDEWNQTNMSRRSNLAIPNIMAIVERLVEKGVIPPARQEWALDWQDLTESTMEEKIDRAGKMSDINVKQTQSGGVEPVFTEDEIRETIGFKPREDVVTDAPEQNVEPEE